jgi:hypothetical protein
MGKLNKNSTVTVRDEDDPVSEDPSERDQKAVYSEDEEREGVLQ